MKLGWGVVAVLMASVSCVFAHDAEVEIRYADGSVDVRCEPLHEKNGVCVWRQDRTSLKSGVKSIRVLPDFAKASVGEDGFYLEPSGSCGRFKPRKAAYEKISPASRLHMPVYGMKTSRGAFLAIATGVAYHASIDVKVTNETYEVAFRFDEDMDNLYEDPVIEYHLLTDPKADYNEMAHDYRNYQLARKAFRPLKERAAKRPELAYAVRCPEVRIRQAWKPVPSPVPRQTAATEPPVKCVVPFARVTELARRMKSAGIKEAELCLVGWNKGGHDGAYPQLFPVESVLGGESALRQCIKDVQALGYQIVAHGNHRDCYQIADSWDIEYVNEKDADGTLLPAERTWGGGDKYTICAKRCYERFVHKDAAAVAALGFRGLYYLDVTTCIAPYTCRDPRHPMTRVQSAAWDSRILDVQTETFGGCASEGGMDAYIGHYDSALTINWTNPFVVPKEDGFFDDFKVPFWQLVYHGVVLSTPFRNIMNATANPDPRYQLKLVEFGGRPTFYIHSRFQSDGNIAAMGDRDLRAVTDKELADSVDCIRKGAEEYARRWHLQYEYMEGHEQIADGVFRTTYSDGSSTICNYNDKPVTVGGHAVPSLSYVIVKGVPESKFRFSQIQKGKRK